MDDSQLPSGVLSNLCHRNWSGCKAARILEMFLLNDANFLQQIHNLQESLFLYRCVKMSSFCMKKLHDKALDTDHSKGLAAVLEVTKKVVGRGEKSIFSF